MASSQVVRIFISSPGDVADEREKAREVVRSLERYFRDVTLQPVLWEELALPATASFQETIDYLLDREPIDIAVFILWSRLGSPLGPAQRRADGSPYRSGTEREFDLMLTAFQQSQAGRPVILAYTRKDEDGFRNLVASTDGQRLEELFAQRKLAESFIQEQFHDQQGRNLRAYHVYREPVSFAQRLKTHLKQALEDLIGTDAAPRWLDEPYRGLRYFEQAHAPIFRGREAETDALLERLDDQQAAGCAFVVVLGASGSGKSSLARAGAAAALSQRVWDERVRQWRVAVFIPGLASQPEQSSPAAPAGFLIRALVEQLAAQVPELTAGINPADLAAGLERDPEMTVRLSIAPAFIRAAEQAKGAVRVLLILDQLEELWTDRRISTADRTRFLSVIHALARCGQVAVLATLRSDFYAAAQSEPVFLALKGDRGLFDLLPPDAAALRRLISEPARLAGLQFEQDSAGRGLDEVILEAAVRDVSRDPGALPLLQYALSELNARRDPAQRVLTFAAWQATGGIDGALGRRADELFQELPPGAQAALPDLLPQLVTVDTDGEQSAVRRRAGMDELAGTADRQLLLTRLIEARFLTAETDPQTGQAVVSLAHEALLRRWPRVADWVHANRDALRLRARVELSQQRWEQQREETSLLLPPGLPLEEGRQLLTTAPHLLREGTVRYLQTSLGHQTTLARRTRRRRQAVVTVLSLLTLTAGLASLFAWSKQQELTKKNSALTQATEAAQRAAQREKLEAKKALAAAAREKAEADKAEAALARSNYFLADARWKERRVGEAFDLLGQVPQKQRRFEWYLARRQFEGSYLTLYGHTAEVTSVAWSPDRRWIASASWDHTIKLWDVATGTELRTLTGHKDCVASIAFSPDGTRLASGSHDRTIKFWVVATGDQQRTLTGHSEEVSSVAFSPDGSRLASCSGYLFPGTPNEIKLWDAATGAQLQTFTGHSDVVKSVAFSPDGKRLASGSWDKTIKLWDAATGAQLQTLTGHSREVNSIVFSPDGTRLASASNDKTIKLWDAATGAELGSFTGHLTGVNSVAFSPDGTRLAAASFGQTIKLWDTAMGVELLTLSGHSREVNSIVFSPDGTRLASGSDDQTVKVWDAATGAQLQTLTGHSNSVYSVAFSPDGTRLASGSKDNTIKVWNAGTGAELLTLTGHTGGVNSVAFFPDGTRLASGSKDNTIKVWDVDSGAELRTLTGHKDSVTSVGFSPGGTRLASGSHDNTIKVWDADTGSELRTLTRHTGIVTSVAFSPDGKRLASGSWDKTIKLWDAATGAELRTLNEHSLFVMSVAFSPDGTRLVSASGSSEIKLWDAATGAELRTLNEHSLFVMSVAFSPDGTRLASGNADSTITLSDAATGAEFRTLNGHTDNVRSVAFSPDGKRLASGSDDKTIKVWDVATGAELRTLTGHSEMVTSIAFSPDGNSLFSLGSERERLAWDVRTGKPAPLPEGWADEASGWPRSLDGRWLVVRSDKFVQLVDLEFKNTPREKARREHAARLDPVRHGEAAKKALEAEDWYAATFHFAWALTAKPEDAETRKALHEAHARWKKQREEQREEQRLARKEPAEPPPGEQWLFPLGVRKALELPEAPRDK